MRSRLPVGALTPVAIGGVAIGAVLIAAGPRYPVAVTLDGAGAGTPVGPAFGVWPLIAVLSVVPAVVAVMLLLVRQRGPALALIASLGVVAIGQVLLNVQLLLDPIRAARAELVAPLGLGQLRPELGAWLLLAGQLLTVIAGLAAAREAGALRGERSMDEPAIGPRTPPGAMVAGVGCAVLAGFGVLTAPYASSDPWLVPRSVLDSPAWSSAGGFALAVGIALAVVLACSAPDPRVAVGGLVGASIGVLGVVVPKLAVAALADPLRITIGPVLATLGGLGLALLAAWVGHRGRRDLVFGSAAGLDRLAGPPASVLAVRCRLAGAALAVLTGGATIAAALTDPLRLAADLPHPELPTRWLLVAAGAVLVPLGVATAPRRMGPAVRPALAVALVVVPTVAGEPLGELLGVLGLDGVDGGPGLWLLLLAVALAGASALALVLAGGFERDEIDLVPTPYEGPVAAASAAAAVLAVPAFWLPLVDGAGWAPTGVLQPPFGLASWGLLAGFAVTAGALLIAPRCRPGQAVALFGGVVVVLVLRLGRLAVAAGQLPPDGLGEGAWATGLCLLLVLVAAPIALRARPKLVLSSVAESGAEREREEVRP
ncbi:MAG TPA: hypothetical protein VK735_30850 [Pseudonocardia sp.]|uniref:hypothetical protein n=1 Tax=Pseudonocardia sp. TaxID=60912 RepID=UPI002BCF404D|nr:hypothetical protein [Pseudonocardia sp.]HTF51866.1 hypothetical protein [Pseudonocardia sp.]